MKKHQSALMILRVTHQPAARGNGSLVEVELLHFRANASDRKTCKQSMTLLRWARSRVSADLTVILLNGSWSTKKGFRPSRVLSSKRKASQTSLKFSEISCLAQLNNFGSGIAKDRDDPAGLSVCVDECVSFDVVVTFPADCEVGVGLLENDGLGVPISSESCSRAIPGSGECCGVAVGQMCVCPSRGEVWGDALICAVQKPSLALMHRIFCPL
jgi:hypothetical protein